MNKASNRILSLALAAAMMLGMFAATPSITAYAVDIGTTNDLNPALAERRVNSQPSDSATALSSPILTQSTIVWFGGYQWVIIGWDGEGVASEQDTATLLFAKANTSKPSNSVFHSSSNQYAGSNLRTAMNTTFYNTIPERERHAIVPRNLAGESGLITYGGAANINVSSFNDAADLYYLSINLPRYINARRLPAENTFDWYAYHNMRTNGGFEYNSTAISYTGSYHPDNIAGDGTTGDNFWALSVAEASLLEGSIRNYGAYWWLRSPGNAGNDAAIVLQGGLVSAADGTVSYDFSVRPAFCLDLSSVIFTSAAVGGKSTVAVGDGLVGASATTGAVKLTVEDSGMATPTLTFAGTTNGTNELRFGYTGAETGANQYVSCVLVDGSGAVQHYGKLVDCATDSSGTLSIPLSGVDDGIYTLKIFNEQANGDYFTDFCSMPVEMTVTVLGENGTVSNFGGTVDNVKPEIDSVSPSGTDISTTAASLVLTFSEEIDITTAGTVTMSPNQITGTPDFAFASLWDVSHKVLTIPVSGLAYNTPYTLNISGFKDVAGNVMDADTNHNFTTTIGNSAKEITGFALDGVTGGISGTNITVTLPTETSVTSLAPTIAVSPNATVSPASGMAQDFTNPVTYTVKAQDNSTQTYTVTVEFANGPYVTPTQLNLDLNGTPTGTFTISLGQSGNHADSASISSNNMGVATVNKSATTTDGDTITVTGVSVGSTTISIGYSGSSRHGQTDTVNVKVVDTTTTPDPDPDPTPTPGSISSGSGSSSSGSSKQDTVRTTAIPTTFVVDAVKAKADLAEMEKSGADRARIRHAGEIKVLVEAWPVFGSVPVDFDTLDENAVQVRVTIRDPGKMEGDTLLSGYVKGSIVDSRRALFEKWFQNKLWVIHLDQQADWGQPVQIAAKLDLTGMDTDNLHFYSYDKSTNSYRRIEKPAYWIDKNGYLRFTTEYAGDIIVSDGPLEPKGQNTK